MQSLANLRNSLARALSERDEYALPRRLGLVHRQVDNALEKYDEWLLEKEEHEKRQRKRG